MPLRGWQCETCKRFSLDRPWCCPTCRTEICDTCFDRYAHCKGCTAKSTDDQLIHAANSQGWSFDATGAAKADDSPVDAGGEE